MVLGCWVGDRLPVSSSVCLSVSPGWGRRCYQLSRCVNWLGTWNEIVKREEVVDVFRKGKFELLSLTETKLKRNGKVF